MREEVNGAGRARARGNVGTQTQTGGLERARRSARRTRRRAILTGLPWLFWLGLAIFALGAAGDIAHHTLEAMLPAGLERLLGPEAVNAHIATLIGMAVIMVAVIRYGVRPRPKQLARLRAGGGKERLPSSSKELGAGSPDHECRSRAVESFG